MRIEQGQQCHGFALAFELSSDGLRSCAAERPNRANGKDRWAEQCESDRYNPRPLPFALAPEA